MSENTNPNPGTNPGTPNKLHEGIWRVVAYSFTPLVPEPTEEYSHYFSSYDAAKQMYEIGEKTMGIRYGLHWHLILIPVDSLYAQSDMDDLAQRLTKELT